MTLTLKHILTITVIFLIKEVVVAKHIVSNLKGRIISVPKIKSISPIPGSSSENIHQNKQMKENSTIKSLPFDAHLEANILKKAIHGFGTDETTIIKVLTRRTTSQRQKILQAFRKDYNKNLVEKLIHLTSGRFKDVIIALLTPKYEFIAKTINKALRNIDSRKQMLIDILCTKRSNSEIYEINFAYDTVFGKSLESHIIKVTAGASKKLFVALSKSNRDENQTASIEIAMQHAQLLYQSGNSSTFVIILTTESFPQINLILKEYERRYSHSLDKAIEEQFSGNFRRGLLALIQNARQPEIYWAERLHECLINVAGPMDDDLIFILVTRSDIDLENIKLAYRILYHRSLAQHISENTHGDYKNTLLALIGTSETTKLSTMI